MGHGVISKISSNGTTFTSEGTKLTAFVDPEITKLPDGRYMLVAAVIPVLPRGIQPIVSAGLWALVSSDGINFGSPVEILSDGKIWIDPAVVQIDQNTYRVFYWSPDDNPSTIRSLTLRL